MSLCRARDESPHACDIACSDAAGAVVSGACLDELQALRDRPEYDAYSACSGSCPVGRDCSLEAGGATNYYGDCDCAIGCAAEQGEALAAAMLAGFRCIEVQTADVCY